MRGGLTKGYIKVWSGKVEGIHPLLVVVNPNNKKIWPVLNFRELNMWPGIDICEEVMIEWRRMERATKIVDLRLAYL